MKRLVLLFTLLVSHAAFGIIVPLPDTATATDLLNSVGMTRTGISSMVTGTGNFMDRQSYDPCVIVNPSDSTKLIMFFSGMAPTVGGDILGKQSVGRATANITDTTTWTISNSGNPVLQGTAATWDSGGVRADSAHYNPADGKIYLYYTGTTSVSDGVPTKIGCATSTDLGLTWTKHGIILDISGAETSVSQLATLVDGTTIHGLYAYRTAGATLPAYVYASASTSDWLTWTKGSSVYSDPDAGIFLESHQMLKIGSTYLVVYEAGCVSCVYDIRFATTSNPATTWTRSSVNPFFIRSGTVGAFDRYHVATPAVVPVNGFYYLFYCGALDHESPVYDNHWQMGVVPLGIDASPTPTPSPTGSPFYTTFTGSGVTTFSGSGTTTIHQ